MHATPRHDASTFPRTPALPTVRDRPAPSRAVPRLVTSRLGWTLGQLATAALVLLALVGSLIVLGRCARAARLAPPAPGDQWDTDG